MMNEDDLLAREAKRHRAVENAVTAGDRIIMEESDGSAEEIDLLTTEVAHRWAEKAVFAARARLHRKEILDRIDTQIKSEG